MAKELYRALKNLVATARTFRDVPKEEQQWTQTDDDALGEAFSALDEYESAPKEPWLNNELQFARLLCEIVANEELPNWSETRNSMDLTDKELQGLYDRAHVVWEAAKVEAEDGS